MDFLYFISVKVSEEVSLTHVGAYTDNPISRSRFNKAWENIKEEVKAGIYYCAIASQLRLHSENKEGIAEVLQTVWAPQEQVVVINKEAKEAFLAKKKHKPLAQTFLPLQQTQAIGSWITENDLLEEGINDSSNI